MPGQLLYTIGYEGRDIESFVAELKNLGIQCLIDVREMPISRKTGFSKSELANRLIEDKIQYVHLRELGAPKEFRSALKDDKNYGVFFEKMGVYLSGQQQAIEDAYRYIITTKCCVMCFERLADQCHRRVIIEKIKERDGNGLQIVNVP